MQIQPLGASPAPDRPAARAPKATPKRPAAVVHQKPRAPKKKPKKGAHAVDGPIATFPAFRMMEGGGSRVFVGVNRKVTVTEHKAQGQIVYRLQGVSVSSRTNQLPLDTSFFATPVSRVRLLPQGEDLDLVIELRKAVDVQYKLEEQRDGVVLSVDFPKFELLATDAPAPGAPKISTETRRLGGGRDSGSGPGY